MPKRTEADRSEQSDKLQDIHHRYVMGLAALDAIRQRFFREVVAEGDPMDGLGALVDLLYDHLDKATDELEEVA